MTYMRSAVLGIDIGGTKTLCALVDDKQKLVHKLVFDTDTTQGAKEFRRELTKAAKSLEARARKSRLTLIGAGAAVAGQVDTETCTVVNAPNVVFLQNFKLGRVLKQALHVETVIGNDVQLALYAEYRLGAAAGLKNVLGIFFGTGVGSAALIEGRIYRGANGFGGQVGSVLMTSMGTVDSPESHATLDGVAGKAAITGAAVAMGIKQWAPHLYKEAGTDISKVTWSSIARALRQGDKRIEELMRARMRSAGLAISSVINFLDPEMLLLGGGLTEAMPKLVVSEVEKGLRELLRPEIAKVLKVRAAKLRNNAAAMGAAQLALETLGSR